MKTNVYAPFWIIKAALPHLRHGSAAGQVTTLASRSTRVRTTPATSRENQS
jgi:NAD(P)-dependent dehydrogenase (short-subunit alcohol dehydrogenase family)